MGDNCNLHQVCSCANHDLPTYEEAVGMVSPRVETSGRMVTPKRETNHDRQPLSVRSLQPSIDPARHTRNTDYTREPRYRPQVIGCDVSEELLSAAENVRKVEIPWQNSFAQMVFILIGLFAFVAVIMNLNKFLRHQSS